MRPQQPVRDRSLSLWQSAVRETILKRAETAAQKAAIEYGVSLHAMSVVSGKAVADLAAASLKGKPDAQQAAIGTAQASDLAFKIAGAHQAGDVVAQTTLFEKLKSLVANYSTLDVVGWAQCLFRYVEYYISAHSSPLYNDWQQQTPPDWSFGLIEWTLPATSKLLIIGDWGTHMDDNVALLRQALKKFTPDAIIHLGDVYYSGTVPECKDNVLDVLDGLAKEPGMKRVPFFTMPGNHDYYSGGAGFYGTIAQVNSSLAKCLQKASYFCLRTVDDNWQFLAMDTGINDRNPVDHMAPSLEKSEVMWHHDKLDNFKGTTILLSHHQLFSANSKIADGQRPWLNESLNAVFRPYYDRIAAWFWGHEHNLVIFKDNQTFGDTVGLRKGRLVGCSAYEEAQNESPYDKHPDCTPVEYLPNMPQLGFSQYKSLTQKFYNHAFTLLEISPAKIVAKYFEYPSWDQDYRPDPAPPIANPIYTEDIARIKP
ncbi:MAG TPA: metallophosphoesterase [Pseudolabrys sp.]|jgi:3',5'-cyclic AMP phosphodiesterase CpdA|nr:metallophosphoesterase [Pseudolabrys sp.]